MLTLCPHIRIRAPAGRSIRQQFVEMAAACGEGPPPFLVMNHTSFLDFFVFTALMPTAVVWQYSIRTMIKAGLFKMPLYGAWVHGRAVRRATQHAPWGTLAGTIVGHRCGSFPVHFARDAHGSFSVDRDKQAPVTAKVASAATRRGQCRAR